MAFILNAIKVFFLFLAECVYSLATIVYQLIITISETNVFTNSVLLEFSSRIYVLLGVFMLFKVSFSLINYIVNPEDFTDKQKGIGKLVPNILITLVLIVFTPRIFAEAMDLQHLITHEHLLERIIMGPQYAESNVGDIGDILSLNLFNAFYYYDEANLPSNAKTVTVGPDASGAYRYSSFFEAFDNDSDYNAYEGIWNNESHYHPLLSLAAAIILLLVLVQFCFDIAVRTVKLGFLQLVAPIPIISRIDPKSSKDGMFNKWFKMSYKTYLDLFVRLIALYAAIAFISVIMETDIEIPAYAGSLSAFMVKAFLMLGALIFAKQLPKIIEDLFGFKLDGGFTLNPMKRLREVPGANIGSAGIAAVSGMVVGAGSNIYAGIKAGDSRRQILGSAIAGGASSFFRSGYSGFKDNKLKPFKAMSAGVKGSVAARNLRDDYQSMDEGGIGGVMSRTRAKFEQFAGVRGSDEATLKAQKKYKMGEEFYRNYGEYEMDENGSLVKDENGEYKKRNFGPGGSRYDHFRAYDRQMADKWEQIENWKTDSYKYDNAREAARIAFQNGQSYTLELAEKDENGNRITRSYTKLEDFESDYNKYINTFNKEKKAFEAAMTQPEHEKFKKEYDLYTSFADNIENEVKLSDLTKAK